MAQCDRLLRIAVLSDIHAYTSRLKSDGSLLDYSGSAAGSRNPFDDLREKVLAEGISADVLMCAGDICNKADFGGLERAWLELQRLRDALGASHLVATCGNHDLDSRYLNDETDADPKGALQSLKPLFPFEDEALTDRFWARNYALVTLPNGVVIVTLNTSAYHGGKEEEIGYGRVSRRTIESLEKDLSGKQNAPAHILLCHHHPLPLSGTARKADGEFIRNGQDLLDALLRTTRRSWLVIHGHRHKPRLFQGASGSTTVPYILGAGSFGARMQSVPNQFHLVDVFPSPGSADHSSVVGIVQTLSWSESSNWSSSFQKDGLPPFCGFGYRGQIDGLANQIAALVPEFMSWQDVVRALPAIGFLTPEAIHELEQELNILGLNVLRDNGGRLFQVGR